MPGGTSARVSVKLGEMTPPPPTPGEEHRGRERSTTGCRWAEVTSHAASAVPVIITPSATRVTRRPRRADEPPGERRGGGGADGERRHQQGGLQRREALALLQVHRQHQEDPGEAGEVEGADEQAVGVAGQARAAATRRAAAGGPARRSAPPTARTPTPAAGRRPARTSGRPAPPSRLISGYSTASTVRPSSTAPTRSMRGSFGAPSARRRRRCRAPAGGSAPAPRGRWAR